MVAGGAAVASLIRLYARSASQCREPLARSPTRALSFSRANTHARSFSLMFSPFGRVLRLRVHNTTPGVMLRDKIQAQR